MALKNTQETFGTIAKFLHWIIAGLIISNFITEYFMHSLPVSDLKWWFYDLHKSLGITALALIAFRVFWRLKTHHPLNCPCPIGSKKHRVLATAHFILP